MENSFDTLFESVPPAQLKNSIMELFFAWVIEEDPLPSNYKQVAEDLYFLFDILNKEEMKFNDKKNLKQ